MEAFTAVILSSENQPRRLYGLTFSQCIKVRIMRKSQSFTSLLRITASKK